MLWVGLTGGIASGKTSVARLLRQRGVDVVCADELSRDVVKKGTEGYTKVVALLGPSSISDDGALNRKEIGRQVFADAKLLKALEDIIHPRVRELTENHRLRLKAAGRKLAFYDVPLLFEKSMEPLFDQIVVVVCDVEKQRARLMKRDGYTLDDANRRIAAQLPLLEKVNKAHYIIDNDSTPEALVLGVDHVLKALGQVVAKSL